MDCFGRCEYCGMANTDTTGKCYNQHCPSKQVTYSDNTSTEVRQIKKFDFRKYCKNECNFCKDSPYDECDIGRAIEACHEFYTEQISKILNDILNDLFHTSSHKLSDKIRLLAGGEDKAGEGFEVEKIISTCKKYINEPENCPFTEESTALCAGCVFLQTPCEWDIKALEEAEGE